MKTPTRLICILLVLLMITGMSCLAAYAAEDAGNNNSGGYEDQSGGSNSGEAQGDQSGGGGYEDQSADGSGNENQGSGDNSGYNDAGSGYDYDSGDSGNNDSYAYPGYVDNGSQDDQGSYSGNDGSHTTPGSAGSVGDKTTLYDTDDVNDKDLEANQWSDIELDESKVDTSGTTDFTQMQHDTATEDDSQWMLYVGIALIGLSLLGILYFIFASAQAKKRNDRRAAAERLREDPRTGGRPHPSEHPAKASRGRYADENPAPRRKPSSRSDTDEIYLPKRVK